MDNVFAVIDSLQSNPDDTFIGKAIKNALKPLESGEENWDMILVVCDLVNNSPQGPRDAIRSIRKQLQNKNNWTIITMTISVIEALVKNCGRRFHQELSNRAFLRELRILLTTTMDSNLSTNTMAASSSTNVMPLELQQRILGMIQCWAFVFRNDKQFKPIKDLYGELVSKDFIFPDLNSSMSMIPVEATQQTTQQDNLPNTNAHFSTDSHTKTFIETIKTKAANLIKGSASSGIPLPSHDHSVRQFDDRTIVHSTTFLSQLQITKLKSEISVVCEHVSILDQIIQSFTTNFDIHDAKNETVPDFSNRKNDLALLDQLYNVCVEMHSRILDIVGLVDEEMLAIILSLVDDINNVFARYLEFKRDHPYLSQIPDKNDSNNLNTSVNDQSDMPLLNLD